MLARKSVKQRFRPSTQVLSLMEDFRQMTNDCIRIGLTLEENGRPPSMRRLSLSSYGRLGHYGGYSKYLLTAISKAAGILSARAKSIKRGFRTKTPYLSKPMLVSCYGFRIEDRKLVFHIDAKRCVPIPLNDNTLKVLSKPGLTIRSFTITDNSISLCISKEVSQPTHSELKGMVGIDRNLRNIAVGNEDTIVFYDIAKAPEIAEMTRSIGRSFKRSDLRIKRQVESKYGTRRKERVHQIIHRVSKKIVRDAKTSEQAIVFEDITGIRSLYRRGNGQSRNYRSKMNSWPFFEIKRQVEYKAAWEGVPVVTLTRGETRGTTMDCPRCGERLQVPIRGDSEHYRQLWCGKCGRWADRDLIAVLNISRRGRLRFDRSSRQGEANEAVKGNAEHEGEPLILRVDASKSRPRDAIES
ncbi:MAG: transposase [Thaumarchaeota archaeon]|nr:transposase [Nitrososphaerota archaeon]